MPVTRRDVLLVGVVAASAPACTSNRRPGPPPRVDPDVALREAALAREKLLLAAYDAGLAAHVELQPLLAPLRADHATHLEALTALVLGAPPVRPTPTVPAPVVPPVATTPVAQRVALRALERSTQAAHRDAALLASRALAPLLASLAACEASHAAVV